MADKNGMMVSKGWADRVNKSTQYIETLSGNNSRDRTGNPLRQARGGEGFWAKITDSVFDTGDGTYHYAWTEQRVIDSGYEDKPGGLSGTTTTNYAMNTNANPITGTPIVWMSFFYAIVDGTPTLVYRFEYRGSLAAIGFITGAGSIGGTYTGHLWTNPGSDVPAGGTLAPGDFGAGTEEILILNMKEIGLSTWDLTDPDNTTDLVRQLTYIRTNDDGMKVFGCDAIWIGCDADDIPDFGF